MRSQISIPNKVAITVYALSSRFFFKDFILTFTFFSYFTHSKLGLFYFYFFDVDILLTYRFCLQYRNLDKTSHIMANKTHIHTQNELLDSILTKAVTNCEDAVDKLTRGQILS